MRESSIFACYTAEEKKILGNRYYTTRLSPSNIQKKAGQKAQRGAVDATGPDPAAGEEVRTGYPLLFIPYRIHNCALVRCAHGKVKKGRK